MKLVQLKINFRFFGILKGTRSALSSAIRNIIIKSKVLMKVSHY